MKALILLFSLVLPITTFAGPGGGHSHDHSAPATTQDKTQTIGKVHVARLVKAGKLDKSWNDAVYDKPEKKIFNGSEEWVVTFTNEKSIKEKKLFVFLRKSGEFVAANFTGK